MFSLPGEKLSVELDKTSKRPFGTNAGDDTEGSGPSNPFGTNLSVIVVGRRVNAPVGKW